MTRRITTTAGQCALVILVFSTLTSVTLDAQFEGRSYPSSANGGTYAQNFMFAPAPSSTPWAPDWAPDGSSIAVAMSGSIWTVDPETGRAEELTYSAKYHSSPDWSPDGRWIIYTADDGGQTIELEIVNVDSGREPSADRRRSRLHRPGVLAGRYPRRVRVDAAKRLLQYLHPCDRGWAVEWGGDCGHAGSRISVLY